MNMQNRFEVFMSQLAETNATLDYFTDFSKVKENISTISVELNQLNRLIGRTDLKQAVQELFEENRDVFNVLEILIAVRQGKSIKTFNREGNIVSLNSYFQSPENVWEYLQDTGLVDIFKNQCINNLVDYVFGIEVGLDSNARKNRGGNQMAQAVAARLGEAGIEYQTEVKHTVFPEIISLGSDVKRFDFVIRTSAKTYLLETNFYNSGGSKLNEVARAYSDIAPKINQYPNYKFVWITDGQGWLSAKNKLEEAFKVIPHIYNLTTLADFIRQVQSEGT